MIEMKLDNPMYGEKRTARQPKWLFGADWPGKRWNAKTRSGHPCQKSAFKGKARCQLERLSTVESIA
jgi:hypothetical protein